MNEYVPVQPLSRRRDTPGDTSASPSFDSIIHGQEGEGGGGVDCMSSVPGEQPQVRGIGMAGDDSAGTTLVLTHEVTVDREGAKQPVLGGTPEGGDSSKGMSSVSDERHQPGRRWAALATSAISSLGPAVDVGGPGVEIRRTAKILSHGTKFSNGKGRVTVCVFAKPRGDKRERCRETERAYDSVCVFTKHRGDSRGIGGERGWVSPSAPLWSPGATVGLAGERDGEKM